LLYSYNSIRRYSRFMPQTNSSLSIVIVGGGFCGVMALVNLLQKTKKEATITLINKGYPLARGIAYKTYSDKHLLNVEARNLSAFPDQPDHFVEWCYRQNDISVNKEDLPKTYLPRNFFGRYLDEIYRDSLKNISSHLNVQIIEDEVIDIDKQKNFLNIKTATGNNFNADRVLLATGNSEPGKPSQIDEELLHSEKYFSNPWSENAVDGLKDDETVLILGNGLTMVDVVQGLREKNFYGKIIALSPHGYKILPHRKLPPQRYILDELEPPFHLEKLFRLFYKHIREARKRGLSGETVVDAMRARTQEIWQHLSLDDKKKFMMHIRHLWGVARHRLPSDVHEEIQSMIHEDKLRVIAGRIRNIKLNEAGIDIKIRLRKDQSEHTLLVARIINCTGPETDINKQKSPLYDSIIKKGFVRSDNMNLGVHATAEGRVIDKNNITSNQIFVIGSLLKGILWESTAVPELRVQAARIAELLLNDIDKKEFELVIGLDKSISNL